MSNGAQSVGWIGHEGAWSVGFMWMEDEPEPPQSIALRSAHVTHTPTPFNGVDCFVEVHEETIQWNRREVRFYLYPIR
jgi:hypothetical protein